MEGICKPSNGIHVVAGSVDCDERIGNERASLLSILLNQFSEQKQKTLKDDTAIDTVREEKIFGASKAYTWIGQNVRLGSITHFPVMPGSYQQKGWGLGWQSMPISFLVKDHQVSFLRTRVVEGEMTRTHLATNKHDAYLSTSLFTGENIPEVHIRAKQSKNALIVVKSLSHVANPASGIFDEWFIQRYQGDVTQVKLAQTWYVLQYEHCVVAICPLKGIGYEGDGRTELSSNFTYDNGNLKITQTIYDGEEKLIIKQRLETAWVVVCLEDTKDIKDKLSQIEIEDNLVFDRKMPRSSMQQIRKISYYDGENQIELEIDPYLY